MTQLRLGSLAFDGGLSGSTPYTLAFITGLAGVGIKRAKVDRESAHGRFPAPGFLEERGITWGGLILTDSPAEQDHAIRALAGKAGLRESVRLTVQGDRTYWCDVDRAEIPDPEILVFGRIASYRCRVEAPGSLLFGETKTFGPATSVSAYHYGTEDAVPVITVTGTMASGYTVNGPGGAQYTVSQALTSGQTHRIDMRTGWLYRNDVLQQGAVSRAQTWTVPPGVATSMSLAPVAGSGSMSVKVTDTFS